MRFWLLFPFLLFGNPKQLTVEAGQAAAVEEGGHLEVTISSEKAVLDWDSFSIGVGESTALQFADPTQNSAVLNRVTGTEVSRLLGELRSNGRVYLWNRNGIFFGKEGRIDAPALIATTMEIRKEAFLRGGPLKIEGDTFGEITHLGSIQTSGGPVVLLAHRIEERGEIEAPDSVVSLAAAHELLLSPSGHTQLLVRPDLKGGGVDMGGTIHALEVQLQADGGRGLAINHEGIIEAQGVVHEGGRIFLSAIEAPIDVQETARLIAPKGEIVAEGERLTNFGSFEAQEGKIDIRVDALQQQGQFFVEENGKLFLGLRSSAPRFSSGKRSVKQTLFGLGPGHLGAPPPTLSTTSGTLTLTATAGITLANETLQTATGNILLLAGTDLTTSSGTIIKATGGAGTIQLVVDNANPASVGSGAFLFNSSTTITTAGGTLQLYASQLDINTFPTTINGTSYSQGSGTNETYSTFYPNGTGGTPFTVFYKQEKPPSPTTTPTTTPPATTQEIQTSVSTSLTSTDQEVSSEQQESVIGVPPIQQSTTPDPQSTCMTPSVSVGG